MYELSKNSWRQLEIKIQYNWRSINAVEWFCLNVKYGGDNYDH